MLLQVRSAFCIILRGDIVTDKSRYKFNLWIYIRKGKRKGEVKKFHLLLINLFLLKHYFQ